MAFLQVSGISKEDDSGFSLQDINFTQETFQHIAIAGETGSGKSTLLKIIAGLEQPDRGDILFEGERVAGPFEKLVPGHEGIAYLSQHFELPKFLRVEQVLRYANSRPGGEAERLYTLCQIDHLLNRSTNQLSGGERQRIALAKLLITSPRLLLLDEPFSNLDMIHKNTLKQIIQEVSKELSITSILVSHDPLDILSWADELMIMQQGRVIQQGTPEVVYRKPINEYVAGLLGKYVLIDEGSAFGANLISEPGERRLFVRPEDVLISRQGNKLNGHITKVSFSGGYYELEVIAGGNLLTAISDQRGLLAGDAVSVSVSTGWERHYL